jgi:pyruvate dehydrogenase (quinone)
MMFGELLTLRQLSLPVKVVVFNNGTLAFVDLEMKAAGIVNFGTDLANPNFANVATAIGLHGVRVERPDELDGALHDAFAHDGPAVVDILTAPQELSMPPKLEFAQIKGFTLYATRTILSGRGDEIVELAKTNLRNLERE